MTVEDYHYHYSYLIQLEKYYNKTVKIHDLSDLYKICKEIERLKKLLKLSK